MDTSSRDVETVHSRITDHDSVDVAGHLTPGSTAGLPNGAAHSQQPATSPTRTESPQEQVEAQRQPQTMTPQGNNNAKKALDLQVGTWRDMWPKDVTSIISVDRNLIVRYFRGLKKLDLLRVGSQQHQQHQHHHAQVSSLGVPRSAQSRRPSRAADDLFEVQVCDSFWVSSLPNISSIHHFTYDKPSGGGVMNCVLCVADDMKRCIVFSVAGDKFEQINTAALPLTASHVVPFMYRGISYFLIYQKGTGEYGIIPFNTVATGTPQLVSKGTFRAGWTDILWKGTHHVRCTRQKFFCYNNSTGETVFECVWVRGASGTSSVCSAEHTTMSVKAANPFLSSTENLLTDKLASDANDAELETALHKKSCIVVPLTIGGKFAALFYSHSQLDPKNTSVLARRQSTSRMIDHSVMSSDVFVTRSMTMYNVAEAASLLLRKRVFAHAEPWTHFCLLSDVNEPLEGGQGSTYDGHASILCYSCLSGEVWINTILLTSNEVSKDVTVFEDLSGVEKNGVSSTLSRNLLGQVRSGGVDVHNFIAEQTNRRSPIPGTTPIDYSLNPNGESKRPPLYDGKKRVPVSPLQSRSMGGDGAFYNASSPFGASGGGGVRTSSARPSSSSLSINDRLKSLPPSTGDYHQDLIHVLRHISNVDFPKDAPYPELAMQQIPKLPSYDRKLAQLNRSSELRSPPGVRASSARSTSDVVMGSQVALGDMMMFSQSPRREPWKPVSPADYYAPAPPGSSVDKFARTYSDHVTKEVPRKLISNEAQIVRLYEQQKDRREEFQKAELDKIFKEFAAKQIGNAAEGVDVKKTVEKLGTTDVHQRRKKDEERAARRNVRPEADIHKGLSLTEMQFEDVTDRLYEQAVQQKTRNLKALKEKVHKAVPLSPKRAISPQNEREMVRRLDEESVKRRRENLKRIEREMEEDSRQRAYDNLDPTHTMEERTPIKLTEEEISQLTSRLYKREGRDVKS